VGKNNKVLDIGSGTGFVIEIWKKLDKIIFGIDISKVAVNNLSLKFPESRFFEVDVASNKLPFENNYFQVVSASSVLYHIIDDQSLASFIKNVHNVLEPGGYFIFSDNFINGDELVGIHQKCRTLSSYQSILTNNKFEIIDREANYVLFNDPVDSKNKILKFIWVTLTKFSSKWSWFDKIIWPILYPIELILTSIIKDSPAQEIMICKAIK
jgi:SAM-dependent methyltransferase